MAETTPEDHGSEHGFVARNNEVIGSVLSLVGLFVSIGLGALVMLATGTRGVAAILTVLLLAGGIFTLLFLVIAAVVRAITPLELWEREEAAWRDSMGLDAPTEEDDARSRKNRTLVAAGAVVAIVLALCLSVVPAVL
jgi:hypothetical protein